MTPVNNSKNFHFQPLPHGLGSMLLVVITLMLACQQNLTKSTENTLVSLQHYKAVNPSISTINFTNQIQESPNFNYFLYPFIYYGGGVAVGDINNDGLPDIYFTSNMGLNALYLNEGNLKFKDITQQAGVAGIFNRWTTGVTMVDINSDGYLDIYVCAAGPKAEKGNLLYLNQGDNTFKEVAKEYGLADNGHSMQAAFFDYDRDGDLDAYIGNYPPSGFTQKNAFFAKKMENPSLAESDRLYRNDGDRFTDVTEAAGILNYGLSLGLSVADYNNDGWADIYVSNDFNSGDYLYINNGETDTQKEITFSNKITEYTRHTSNFGMGTDAADINNDGLIDLMQLDMMASNNQQQKANMSAMNPAQFQELVDKGLHYQYMKNTLQLNNGVGGFSDISELAGVAYTDWSWGTLLLDMNNDGNKDIFITNGMRRNVNDNDFNAYLRIQQAYQKIAPNQYYQLLEKMPTYPVENFVFHNHGDLNFQQKKGDYGLNFKGFSNGAAYADLDLDGDLDMVVNNLDAPAQIFENSIPATNTANYLKIKLEGNEDNPFGIGSKVTLFTNGQQQFQELYLTRGYQSSVEPILHFGVGTTIQIDSIHITWTNGLQQSRYKIAANQLLVIKQEERLSFEKKLVERIPLFTSQSPQLMPAYRHQENDFDDFKREVLLPHKMSQLGPALAIGDVNRDGRNDFYVGGAQGFSGALYLQQTDGDFIASQLPFWQKNKIYEEVAAVFFDANGDDFPDLYIQSGGNESPEGTANYQDRLYLNNQKGDFTYLPNALPKMYASGACVKPIDFDKDGDIDLFIGNRQIPGQYPLPASSYLFRNDSDAKQVKFTDITHKIAPMLQEIGMVTDAAWVDFDTDGWTDLIIVGEWMPITFLKNDEGKLKIENAIPMLSGENSEGWWNTIEVADLDKDGDMDFVAGNLGLNYKYKATEKAPFKIFAGDVDKSGSLDIVLGYYEAGNLYPLRGRECSSQQVPSIKKAFPNYTTFSSAKLTDVYPSEVLNASLKYEVTTFASTIFLNENGVFKPKALPNLAQISSINAIQINDLNQDGHLDLLVGGNKYHSEVETPRSDGSYGLFLAGDGQGNFTPLLPHESGLNIEGEIRHIMPLDPLYERWLVARNDKSLIELSTIKKAKPSF